MTSFLSGNGGSDDDDDDDDVITVTVCLEGRKYIYKIANVPCEIYVQLYCKQLINFPSC
jgi:hypothetical protein